MEEITAKEVVSKITATARNNGVSMNKLALETGCHVWTLKRWEDGTSEPLYSNVVKLKSALKKLIKRKPL